MEDRSSLWYVILAGVLAGSGSGAGMNMFLSQDHYKIIKEDISEIKDTDKDLYKKMTEITQRQNECYSTSQILRFRLDNLEKYK